MKKCYICFENLPFDCFYKHRKQKDGLQSYCKKCSIIKRIKYYKDNKKQEIKVRKDYQNKQKDRYINYKKTLTCIKCNENRWYVLEFHHKDDNKIFDISSMSSGRCSWDTILNEIKKCEVLCANCHREKHFFERQIKV